MTRRVFIERARSTSAEFHLKKRSESLWIDPPLNGCKLTRAKTGGLLQISEFLMFFFAQKIGSHQLILVWSQHFQGSNRSQLLHAPILVMLSRLQLPSQFAFACF